MVEGEKNGTGESMVAVWALRIPRPSSEPAVGRVVLSVAVADVGLSGVWREGEESTTTEVSILSEGRVDAMDAFRRVAESGVGVSGVEMLCLYLNLSSHLSPSRYAAVFAAEKFDADPDLPAAPALPREPIPASPP